MERSGEQQVSDRDGKSTTSSAVDAGHYPDMRTDKQPEGAKGATEAEIAALAYQLWERKGRPAHSQQEDWMDAERQLGGSSSDTSEASVLMPPSGSVQR